MHPGANVIGSSGDIPIDSVVFVAAPDKSYFSLVSTFNFNLLAISSDIILTSAPLSSNTAGIINCLILPFMLATLVWDPLFFFFNKIYFHFIYFFFFVFIFISIWYYWLGISITLEI